MHPDGTGARTFRSDCGRSRRSRVDVNPATEPTEASWRRITRNPSRPQNVRAAGPKKNSAGDRRLP